MFCVTVVIKWQPCKLESHQPEPCSSVLQAAGQCFSIISPLKGTSVTKQEAQRS